MLLPFVWMISTSLKPADQLFTVPPTWLPRPLQWDTYVKAMSAGNFGRYALNSLLLGVTNTFTNVLLAALAGYAFARLRFPGRNPLFLLVLATLMVPYQVTIIPLFVIVRHIPLFGGNDILGQGGIGWVNPYLGVVRRERSPRPGWHRLDQLVLGADRAGCRRSLRHLHVAPVFSDTAS